MNFFVDESFSAKGANAVVSMLHYYLEHHGLNSVIIHLNADNCSGQNKNNALLQVSKLHSNSPLLFVACSTFHGEY